MLPKTLLMPMVLLAGGCTAAQTVDDQVLYRAPPLSERRLEEEIRRHHIKTVLNLRGFHPDQQWYRQQREVCERNNVEQLDFTLNAEAPDREEVIRLLQAFRVAKEPMLAQEGYVSSDAGFVAALYRLAIQGEPKAVAQKELAFWQSERNPVDRFTGYAQFIENWQGEKEFYETYQLGTRPVARDFVLANFVVPEPDEPHEDSKGVGYRGDTASAASAKTTWEELRSVTDRLGDSSPSLASDGSLFYPESGKVLSDYSSVIVSGPVSDGPILIGRAGPVKPLFQRAEKPANVPPVSPVAPSAPRLGIPSPVPEDQWRPIGAP